MFHLWPEKELASQFVGLGHSRVRGMKAVNDVGSSRTRDNEAVSGNEEIALEAQIFPNGTVPRKINRTVT